MNDFERKELSRRKRAAGVMGAGIEHLNMIPEHSKGSDDHAAVENAAGGGKCPAAAKLNLMHTRLTQLYSRYRTMK